MTHIDLSKRTHFPAAFDERATLTQLLSYVRLTVHSSRRLPGTTATATSSASSPMASPATNKEIAVV